MPEAYIGEIRLFAGTYTPDGWLPCQGQRLSITQYEVLFAVIGTTWGGDPTGFDLPDLRGRVPIGAGQGAGLSPRNVGQTGGAEQVVADLPVHSHHFYASTKDATQKAPAGQTLAKVKPDGTTAGLYLKVKGTEQIMANDSITDTGSGAAHANVMPSIGLNYIICTLGEYPEKS